MADDVVVTGDVTVGAEALARGGLVAFPTETVYGLGADASDPAAVKRIFTAKGRPAGHPLIVHLASVDQVTSWARMDAVVAGRVALLAEAFWPGPLTMIVPRSDRVVSETVGGRASVGLRVPDHPVALALLAAFGGGVAAPSANRFGRVSPTTAGHVLEDLGDVVDVIIDGGPTAVGIESTIVELTGARPVLLRPGAVSREELVRVLGEPVDGPDGEARAPGMLQSHYAPDARVEVVPPDQLGARLTELGQGAGPGGIALVAPVDLVPAGLAEGDAGISSVHRLAADAEGYASGLYAALRAADRDGPDLILVVAPLDGAMVEAVADRLDKAAAPRPADRIRR